MLPLHRIFGRGVAKLIDSLTFFQDNADPTKQVQLQLSGITTGTTRTVTMPDASGTMVLAGSGSVQTFADGAALKDSVSYFYDNADATKKLAFQVSGVTTATTRTKTVKDTDATLAEVGDNTAASGTAASGATAPAFTGTTPTQAADLATPVFSGTGQASSGQVITTTDNQTMLINECAGMWFVSAEHGPYLIASNTAVTGAPAVLTIYGTAPTTDAGTYKILRGPTPVGAVASHTHTGPSHVHALA